MTIHSSGNKTDLVDDLVNGRITDRACLRQTGQNAYMQGHWLLRLGGTVMTEISVGIEVVSSPTLSYTYLGTRRPTVYSVTLTNTGPDATAGTVVEPRIRIE